MIEDAIRDFRMVDGQPPVIYTIEGQKYITITAASEIVSKTPAALAMAVYRGNALGQKLEARVFDKKLYVSIVGLTKYTFKGIGRGPSYYHYNEKLEAVDGVAE